VGTENIRYRVKPFLKEEIPPISTNGMNGTLNKAPAPFWPKQLSKKKLKRIAFTEFTSIRTKKAILYRA